MQDNFAMKCSYKKEIFPNAFVREKLYLLKYFFPDNSVIFEKMLKNAL